MKGVLYSLLCVSTLCLFVQFGVFGQFTSWNSESNQASFRLGARVDYCDINNDNYTDFVSTGAMGVMVWMGNSSGFFSTTPDYNIYIITPNITTDGLALECADINQDGFADVIVGDWTPIPTGALFIYNGMASGLNTTNTGWPWTQGSGWYYGCELIAADYDADGKMDLAVGLYGYGKAVIHKGLGAAGLNPSSISPAALSENKLTYAQNMEACDLSGDGYPDLLIGCRSCASTIGTMYIISNNVGTFTKIFTWNGTATAGFYSYDIKCGDFNADGKKDFAVLAQGEKALYIHYGTGNINTISRTPNITINLVDTCRSLSVGDINNDGYDDIIGGYNTVNQARVFFGGPTLSSSSTASYAFAGPSGNGGWDVVAMPNLDGVGTKELALGSWTYANGQTSEGAVAIVYNIAPSATPSITPSTSPSASVTPSTSPTASVTPSTSPTASVTPSSSPSPSRTPSVTPTPSVSPTSAPTITPTPSPTASVTPTSTPSNTPTPSTSSSPTPSMTPSISVSPTTAPESKSKGLDPTIVISVGIGVPIISCTFFGTVLAFLLIRRRRKNRKAAELPMMDVGMGRNNSSPGTPPTANLSRGNSFTNMFNGSSVQLLPPSPPIKPASTIFDAEDNSNYASMPSGLNDDGVSEDSRSTGTGTIGSGSKRPNLPKEQDWEIPFRELKALTKIGAGAYGEVYRARWKGVDVAVKKVLSSSNDTEESSDLKIQDFFAEADLMRKLKPHPNITQLLGVCIHPLCIVTEFIENQSLHSWIASKKEMTNDQKLTIIKGTAAGMLHLHSQGVVHRDLAARNILLDGAMRPKVCDFGMSRVVLDNRSNSTEATVGPIKWMSPESLTSRQYSTKSDVWSFGVVIYEILTRTSPYENYNLMQIGTKVALGSLSLVDELANFKETYPENILKVFKQCLEFKAENRPEFEDIVNMLD